MQLEQSTLSTKVAEPPITGKRETFYYDNAIVRNFSYATIIWGVVGMLAGLWVALQLVFPTRIEHRPMV